MKKFKSNYSFADLWKQFVMFTKNWRRKSTGELVNKDTLELTGDVKCFENIVDKDGHKRFIEGDIETTAITEGLAVIYSKWTLSGTHLMAVVVISNDTNEDIVTNTDSIRLKLKDVPSWILGKIYTQTTNTPVDYVEPRLLKSGAASSNIGFALKKPSSTELTINKYYSSTITANSYVRIEFDLIIDNTPAS